MMTKLKTFSFSLLILSIFLSTAILANGQTKGNSAGFIHGIVIKLDGQDYYMAGPPDGLNGATDIPGHFWVQTGPDRVIGKHYNIGPFGMPQWWSSDAKDGELLYIVSGIIDTWSEEKAQNYASEGYVHYHELISVSNGEQHPTKIVWLKHTARTSFYFDRGPHPEFAHYVSPGIDFEFVNNYFMPY